MTQHKKFIHYKGFHLHYRTYGNGSKALLAFHGFGGTGADWSSFEDHIGNEFTIYAFDIFYHGSSTIDKEIDPYVDNAFWMELIEYFMRENKINRISILGYSLGSKLALCLVEMMAGHIDNVFVMAPDGLKISFWSQFAVKTSIGKWSFKRIIKNPAMLFKVLGILKRVGLIHEKMDNFIRMQLSDEAKRKQVFNVWMLFRDLIPEKRRVQKHIFRYNINFKMFFGRHDIIIPLKPGEEFSKRIKKPTLHIFECGHQMNDQTYEICMVIKDSLK